MKRILYYHFYSLRRKSLHLFALIVLFSFSAAGAFALKASYIRLKGAPSVIQLPNYCGPAALSSLFGYWGKPINQITIARSVYDKKLKATNGADLLLYARERGFSAYTSFSDIRTLKDQLEDGFPVLVLQDLSSEDHQGHFRIVVGYDDNAGSFLVRDTNYESIRHISYRQFDETWKSFDRWALIVCPKGREDHIDPKIRNNLVLHLDLGEAYLRHQQLSLARWHLRKALKMDPDNEDATDMLAQLASLRKISIGGAMKRADNRGARGAFSS